MTMRSERRQAIWDVTDGRCFYCGEVLISDSDTPRGRAEWKLLMQVDHSIPLCRGGTNDLKNLVPCCGYCNPAKGSMTVEEWRIWLMISHGRAPVPFFGEKAGANDRDWLILYGENRLDSSMTRMTTEPGILRSPASKLVEKQQRILPSRLARYLGDEVSS